MTEEQYLALDASSDAKYERIDGIVTMLRPASSAYGATPTYSIWLAVLWPTRHSVSVSER